MVEEDVVAISAPTIDIKRKFDEIESVVHTDQRTGSDDASNGFTLGDSKESSDSSQAKRPKLNDEAAEDCLDIAKTQENSSPVEIKTEELCEEKNDESKEEESEKSSPQKDENQDFEPLVDKIQDSIVAEDSENKPADDHLKPDENQNSLNEASISEENIVEECKNVNGNEPHKEGDEESKELNDCSSQKEIGKENKEFDGEISQKDGDNSQMTRRIEVPSSKVGVLIGKRGETIRYLQFNSGAKIQILRDSEADPNSLLRPVEIIGTVSCIENAEQLIKAVIAEAEAGGSPALVAKGHLATHSIGIPEQIEMKIPNDKVGMVIGRGGETIRNMQTSSGARIQLIPQLAEGEGSKERTVRISGDKRQIDIATDMIKDVMYQNARPSPYSGGYNQSSYRSRGSGGPPQWGSRDPHAPHSMPYDYHHRGPYSSQGSHYNSPGYGDYPPQHMPPRGGYGSGWDQRPPHSGPYDYYGRQGPQTSGPLPPPSSHSPAPALGGPPPSQVNYGYGQSHVPEYGHAAPYSQTGHQPAYGQMYEQPKYDNYPPMQPPYGGSYPPAGGGQPGYSQMQQPGGPPYGMQQGPVQQGYGPPRPAAAAPSSGDVPYQGATPAAPAYGSTNTAPQQQQYGYTSTSAPAQQQTYPSYNSAPTSEAYNNGTQTPAPGQTYQQESGQPASSSTHDQPGAQQAGYGGYGSYPSTQPTYDATQTQNSGNNYGYNTNPQDPNYGYVAAPGSQQLSYPQAATSTQAGYEQQQAVTQQAAAPGSAQTKTQSPPQSGYGQYNANQVYAAPR